MKNILLGLIISVLSIPAFAGSFNGNVSYNSDYVWRGVSQTQGKPSVHLQGEVLSDLVFYAGFYGATVDFVGEVDTDVELDLSFIYGGGFIDIVYETKITTTYNLAANDFIWLKTGDSPSCS